MHACVHCTSRVYMNACIMWLVCIWMHVWIVWLVWIWMLIHIVHTNVWAHCVYKYTCMVWLVCRHVSCDWCIRVCAYECLCMSGAYILMAECIVWLSCFWRPVLQGWCVNECMCVFCVYEWLCIVSECMSALCDLGCIWMHVHIVWLVYMNACFLHAKPWRPGDEKSDIHGCYSLVKIAFVPICACKNNRQIWHHNISASRSRDVTDQLWWRHNVKSEKTVLSDNGEMSDRWLFVAERCAQDIK